ncbi:MAG: dihydrolipoamide acetyltransferase family protein [Desulfobacterales bacterium]
MAESFKLPDLGEGIHEGEVIEVKVSVGDEVKEGDIIIEVETDKAAVEIPSPFTSTVRDILVKPDDVVTVGQELMIFGAAEAAEPAPEEKPAEKPAEAAEAETYSQPARREEEPVPASPATRRLARELGVDLRQVKPSGPGGRVTSEDVRSFSGKAAPAEKKPEVAEKPAKAAPDVTMEAPQLPDFSKWGPVEAIPLRSIRRTTARQMGLAWSQIPHAVSQDMADITKLESFRQKHKGEIQDKSGKLTLIVFVLKAVVTALKTYPYFNSTLNTAAGEIILKHYYHLGVAVDTDNGLMVPVIRDVDRKSIAEISIELKELVQKARDRKISLEEMQGGTFTITNAGALGGGQFVPIINYPQVAILGMGAARLQPVVVEKDNKEPEIVPRLMMPLVVCIDHRVLDGSDAIRFLNTVVDALEDPEELLMTMV